MLSFNLALTLEVTPPVANRPVISWLALSPFEDLFRKNVFASLIFGFTQVCAS